MSPPTTARVSLVVRASDGPPLRHVNMSGRELRIGRDDGEVRIEDALVSPVHAAVELDDEGWPSLRDLGSMHGTFLNARLVVGSVRLRDGDEIRIGSAHLLVRIASG